jgi:hypothetical protein
MGWTPKKFWLDFPQWQEMFMFYKASISKILWIVTLVWYMAILNYSQVSTWQYSMPAQPPTYAMRVTSTKFGLHAGNMKFSTQNEECMWKYTYTCCKIETFIKKWNLQPTLECHCFKHIFTKWQINVILVSINKQIASFKHWSGVLSRLCQGKG